MRSIISAIILGGLVITVCSYALMSRASVPKDSVASETQSRRRHRIITTASPRLKRFNDVGELAAESPYIVVGVPVYQAAHVRSPSDRFVFTDYRVKVLSVLKGNVTPGEVVSVRTEGGNINLPDGTEVETTLPSFWKSPVKGQGYVLFLFKQNEANRYFRLTGGPQGLFLISPWNNPGTRELSLTGEEVVVPQVRPSDQLMKSYQGMKVTSFLASPPLKAGE